MFGTIILCIALASTQAVRLKHELKIQEGNAQFKEEVGGEFTKDNTLKQVIKVPQHNRVNGMTQVNDLGLGISIYRMDVLPTGLESEEKLCYVTSMTLKEKFEFEEFEIGIQIVNSPEKKVVKPTSYTKVTTNFLVTGEKDTLSAEKLAVAKQHCGTNRIVAAIKADTGMDASKWATERLHKSNAPVVYDYAIRDIFTCDDASKNYALASFNKCKGVLTHIKAVCTFRTSACAYILSCPYSSKLHYWNCKGKHNFHNSLCCQYECRPNGL